MPDVTSDRARLLDVLALGGEQSTLALASRLGAHKPHVLDGEALTSDFDSSLLAIAVDGLAVVDRPADATLMAAAPDLAASVAHHARRAEEAEARAARLAEHVRTLLGIVSGHDCEENGFPGTALLRVASIRAETTIVHGQPMDEAAKPR